MFRGYFTHILGCKTFIFHGFGAQGWWQIKYLLLSTLSGEDEPILTSIFFKGVGSTTN